MKLKFVVPTYYRPPSLINFWSCSAEYQTWAAPTTRPPHHHPHPTPLHTDLTPSKDLHSLMTFFHIRNKIQICNGRKSICSFIMKQVLMWLPSPNVKEKFDIPACPCMNMKYERAIGDCVLAKICWSVCGTETLIVDSPSNFLHFELLIASLAQILTELWQFKVLTSFGTRWSHQFRNQ